MEQHPTSQHTPGLWFSEGSPYLSPETGCVTISLMFKRGHTHMYPKGCVANVYGIDRATARANASLIAAAPDLLAACEYALSHEDCTDTRDVLRKAITKALDA